MPLYHVHVAASREDPLPPVLTTIEADDPADALAKLSREPLVVQGGMVGSVWLKVVVSYHPSGEPRHVLSTELPVMRIVDAN